MMRVVGTLLALFFFLTPSVWAQDVIRLKNGAKLKGTILAETKESITLQIKAGSVELKKELVSEVLRGRRNLLQEKARALLTLSHFPEQESWHLVYRKGHRVGYRHVELKREVRQGVGGYVLKDRLVFLSESGQGPDAELDVEEFVDADLQPRQVLCRRAGGASGWQMEGLREGDRLHIKERSGGATATSTALFEKGVELWGLLLRRLAQSPPPEGGYPPFTLFDPERKSFTRIRLERRIRRVNLAGHTEQVLIFRCTAGGRVRETWLDMAGKLVRDEIQGPFLISLRTSKERVLAYARGDGDEQSRDLKLLFRSDETGLSLLRPDRSWEMDVPLDGGPRLLSLSEVSLRATVDVFRLQGFPRGTLPAGLALKVMARMQRAAKNFRQESIKKGPVGAGEGLLFRVVSRRRGTLVTTLGALVMDGEQAFVILCAAPSARYGRAEESFKRLLGSLKFASSKPPPVPPKVRGKG